jgi:hypothetical protein
MAGFDPSIWNAIPQPRSFLDYAGDFANLRGAQQRHEMNALSMQEQRDRMSRENALMTFESGLGNTPEDQLPGAYQQAGYITQAENLRGKQSTRRRDAASAAQEDQRTAAGKRQFLMQGLNGINDPESVRQHLADGVVGGVYSMQDASKLMRSIPKDPVQLAQWRDALVMGPDKVQDNVRADATLANQNRHQLELERLRALEVNAAATRAGHEKAPRMQLFEGPEGFRTANLDTGVSHPVVDAGGANVLGKRGQALAQKARDAGDMATLAAEAEPLLREATGSGIGAGVDWAAGLFGASPSGADAIASLRVIQGKMLALTERMEGPQSDADRKVYEQAVGRLSDPSVPVPQKQAALQTVRTIQGRYVGRSAPKMPGTDQVSNTRATPLLPSRAPNATPMTSTMVDLGGGFSFVPK